MHAGRRAAAALGLVLLSCGGDGPFASLSVLGTNVEVRAALGDGFERGASGRELSVGDVLRTDDNGFGEIGYFDGSLTRLDKQTSFAVEDLVRGDRRSIHVRLDVGRSWNKVNDEPDGDYRLSTPVAVATVRGTAFVAACEAAGPCSFTVVDGVVDVRTTSGEEFVLRANDRIEVAPDGTAVPSGAGVVQRIGRDALLADEWVARNRARDAGLPETSPAVAGGRSPSAGPTPTAAPAATPTPSATPPHTPDFAAANADIAGTWSGNWGTMYLKPVKGRMRGIYTHDDGRVIGDRTGNRLAGWWSEVPSRKPDGDAGRVEFEFVRDAEGFTLDGRWMYGAAEEQWRENWDLRYVGPQIPPEIELLFESDGDFPSG